LAVQSPLVAPMAASPQTVFRQRFCKASDCRTLFFICTHCDRGQRYCSLICRRICRLQQRRTAGRRHQQSLEGRLDHRDRQRAYRLRRAASSRVATKQNVTDHGSQSGTTSVTMPTPCNQHPEPNRSRWFGRMWQATSGLGLVICRFCGRVGRFLNPFHESG
jgi:hypothetical protein